MREPLFNLPLPIIEEQSYLSGDPRSSRIVVIQQAYGYAEHQGHIDKICTTLHEQAGVLLFAVDGAQGPVHPTSFASNVSVGVISMLRRLGDRVAVVGVDDEVLHQRHQRAQAQLLAARQEIDRAFELVQRLLRDARKKVLPKHLHAVGTIVGKRRFGHDVELSTMIDALEYAFKRQGKSIRTYPALGLFDAARVREKALRFDTVETQRTQFAERVVGGTLGWFDMGPHGQITVDAERIEPYLQYWAQRVGLTQAEFDDAASSGRAEQLVAECVFWYMSTVLDATREAVYGGYRRQSQFYDDLMRLALATEIQYFDLTEFRQYVSYVRLAGQTPVRRVADELDLAQDDLSTTPAEVELIAIERTLGEMYRAVTMTMDPAEADRVELVPDAILPLVAEAVRLGGARLRRYERAASTIERSLPAARDYLSCGQARGESMVAAALRLLAEKRDDRLALIVGGFHSRAVVRALEDSPAISWCVITPELNLKGAS